MQAQLQAGAQVCPEQVLEPLPGSKFRRYRLRVQFAQAVIAGTSARLHTHCIECGSAIKPELLSPLLPRRECQR